MGTRAFPTVRQIVFQFDSPLFLVRVVCLDVVMATAVSAIMPNTKPPPGTETPVVGTVRMKQVFFFKVYKNSLAHFLCIAKPAWYQVFTLNPMLYLFCQSSIFCISVERDLEGGVQIPHSRSFVETIPHPEHLSYVSRIPFCFPISRANIVGNSAARVAIQSRFPSKHFAFSPFQYCISVKSGATIRAGDSKRGVHAVPSKPGGEEYFLIKGRWGCAAGWVAFS